MHKEDDGTPLTREFDPQESAIYMNEVLGMSLREIGDGARVNASTVSRIIRGITPGPTYRTGYRLVELAKRKTIEERLRYVNPFEIERQAKMEDHAAILNL